MTKHIKTLYITALLIGQPIPRILVDNGVAVNIVPARMLKKLYKDEACLIPSQVTVSNFAGGISHTKEVLAI